jgi:hypothetical protein
MPRDDSPSSVNCSLTISSCADPTRTSLPDNRRSTKRSLIPAVDAGALHLASGVADGLPCVSTHEVAGGARSSRNQFLMSAQANASARRSTRDISSTCRLWRFRQGRSNQHPARF